MAIELKATEPYLGAIYDAVLCGVPPSFKSVDEVIKIKITQLIQMKGEGCSFGAACKAVYGVPTFEPLD